MANSLIDLANAKYTITPAINDTTGERLGFVPFDLNSKQTASALFKQYQLERSAEKIGVAVRVLNIARCAFLIADIIKYYGGKCSRKVADIVSDDEINSAITATDESALEVSIISAKLRNVKRTAERAALVGQSPDKLKNTALAVRQLEGELTTAKEAAREAKKKEADICATLVSRFFPSFIEVDTNTNN